ncbi:MAG: PEP/pyruvate-binding domain-containing protein [Pirellulales bacterium]
MLVAPLETLLEIRQCGGKAFPLQRLMAEGWRVPRGFVVTTNAFELCRTVAASSSLGAVPTEIVDAIRQSLGQLGDKHLLAVRSSAVGEDSREAAFAGLLATRLRVEPTLEKVLEALQFCWSSYDSSLVREYQRSRGKALQGMAVIVQQLVVGEFSGVMFTRHPAPNHQTARVDSILVEYCPGLGEDLVSGRVTPISQVIHRSATNGFQSMTIAADRTSSKKSCDRHEDVSRGAGQLSARTLELLRIAADRLELLFGGPQDVEWTCDAEGEVYWLQSRPVTTLGKIPLSARTESASPLTMSSSPSTAGLTRSTEAGVQQHWTNANLNENYPEPVTPLLASLAQQCYYHYFRNLGVALGIQSRRIAAVENELRFSVGTHAGRLYYNLSNIEIVLASAPYGDWLVNAFLDFIGASDKTQADEAAQDENSQPSPSATRPSRWRRINDGWETVQVFGRVCRLAYGLERGLAQFERDADQFAERAHPTRLASLSRDQLLVLWREFADIRFHRWLPGSLADAASMVSYALLKRALRHDFPEQEQASLHNSLLRGLREVVSVGPAESLWAISRLVRSTPDWSQWISEQQGGKATWEQLNTDARLTELRGQLNNWLEKWGFRCSGELLLTVPSYQEQPQAVTDLLRTYVRMEGESPEERLIRQEKERSDETERILRVLASRPLVRGLPWPSRKAYVRRLAHWTQQSIICRERARLKQALLYQRLRRLLLEIGARFQTEYVIEQPDDVFFLNWQEVESLLAGGSGMFTTASRIAAVRRAEWQSDHLRTPPRDLVLERGEVWRADSSVAQGQSNATTPLAEADQSASDVLTGTGACGGVIDGRACVLDDVRQVERLLPGDILVVRQTDPGWATVFPLVKGLVMERGGMLSHGAILAREYGLPTVVGVNDATELLAHSPEVRVDGDRGEVRLK